MLSRFFVALAVLGVLALASAEHSDYVIVPGGRMLHRDCVHAIPASAVHTSVDVDGTFVVAHKSGEVRRFKCDKEPRPFHGPAWKAWTQYQNPKKVSLLYGEWAVPPAPPANDGQILYFWNGVEPDDNSAVLQPVLQWGSTPAGGGAYWAVASWYVSDTQAFFSQIMNVAVGDTILGTNDYNTNSTWTITAASKKTGKSTGFTHKPPQSNDYTWAYQVLEAYTISNCKTDYPKTNKIYFNNIKVSVAGSPVQASWQVQTKNPTCQENAQAESATQTSISWNS